MATVISFASQKGGVGKTTSAINVSTALALGGYRVLMVDLDPQDSVRASFGVKTKPEVGTRDLFCRPEIELTDLCAPTNRENMDFIFSNIMSMSDEKEVLEVASEKDFLKNRIFQEVDGLYDFVIVDAPPATGMLSLNAMVAADLIVIPLQCEALAIKSLRRLLLTFRELQSQIDSTLRIAGILLTMYNREIQAHRSVARQAIDELKKSIFRTIIPNCEEIVNASALGKSVIDKNLSSVGATAYVRLANEILDRFQLR